MAINFEHVLQTILHNSHKQEHKANFKVTNSQQMIHTELKSINCLLIILHKSQVLRGGTFSL